MQEEQVLEALNKHWRASATGALNAEHGVYDDDAIRDYAQSGERILGRRNLQALQVIVPTGRQVSTLGRILGKGDL
jgi:hypothetical protein